MSIETMHVYCTQCVRITFRPMCIVYAAIHNAVVLYCADVLSISAMLFCFVCMRVSISMHTCVMSCIHGTSIEPLLHVLFYVYTVYISEALFEGAVNLTIHTHFRTYALSLFHLFLLLVLVYAFPCVCVWAFLFTSVSADKKLNNQRRKTWARNTQGKKGNTSTFYVWRASYVLYENQVVDLVWAKRSTK